MRYQDFAVSATKEATEFLFRTARAVPADKLDWKPMSEGRSVLEQLQECAQSPAWFIGFINPGAPKMEFSEEAFAKMLAERQQWKTLEDCEKACKENSEKLFQAIQKLSDADLDKEIPVPWSEKPETVRGMTMGQYWNLTYHAGQVNYVQTLYGDKEMH